MNSHLGVENMDKSFYIYNFGCKVNQEEGGALSALFLAHGWQEGSAEQAKLFVVNTCTVTQVADKKARNLIRRLRRMHPKAIIAVCGCYAQRDAESIQELCAANIITGVEERRQLPELAESILRTEPAASLTKVGDIAAAHDFTLISKSNYQGRARAYLKIEDGCEQFCNYCIVPHVRGPVRSLPMHQAVERAKNLIAAGHGEIVLSGIHIGAYGQDLPPGEDLSHLIQGICALPGLLRLRLGSIEPQQLEESLFDTLSIAPKLCRHLHIPLQSGSDRTLAAMGRCYDSANYSRLIASLRNLWGDFALTTDVMVGYPGETEDDFQSSLAFCEKMAFADMHVFPYSRRQGTPAATAPSQISQAVKAERAACMGRLAESMKMRYLSRYIGTELEILPEEREKIADRTYIKGHSGNYIMLYLPVEQGEREDEVNMVRVCSLFRDGLLVEKT